MKAWIRSYHTPERDVLGRWPSEVALVVPSWAVGSTRVRTVVPKWYHTWYSTMGMVHMDLVLYHWYTWYTCTYRYGS
jgi:hypothetical protein